MTRIKRGVMTRKRHKRLLKKTKGYWGQRKNVFKRAKQTLMRAMAFAFEGRKLKKRDMRSLFVARVSAAAQANGLPYNKFIHGLSKSGSVLNRKMLSQIAIYDPKTFSHIVSFVNK